jgi:hypothetical protein
MPAENSLLPTPAEAGQRQAVAASWPIMPVKVPVGREALLR